MSKKKNIRQRGKIQFSEYFKELNINDKVAIVQEKSVPSYYPKRVVGLTGNVIGTKGRSKIIKVMDGNLSKEYIVHPIHLKKLK
jgi:ribosomal protein L21E